MGVTSSCSPSGLSAAELFWSHSARRMLMHTGPKIMKSCGPEKCFLKLSKPWLVGPNVLQNKCNEEHETCTVSVATAEKHQDRNASVEFEPFKTRKYMAVRINMLKSHDLFVCLSCFSSIQECCVRFNLHLKHLCNICLEGFTFSCNFCLFKMR